MAILPDFDEFLLISSKLDYLYRCNRHPTPKMPKSTLCLPPVRWGPRALDSLILPDSDEFLPISSKLDHLYRFSRNLALPMVVLIFCLPLARWGHRALYSQCSGNIVSLRWISSNLIKVDNSFRFKRHPTHTRPKLTLCLPPARWGPRALDYPCSGNIARFRWISYNFI